MSIKLNPSNFFKHYIIHPRSNNLSKKDKNKALIFSIALAVLLGIPHAVAKIREYKFKKIIKQRWLKTPHSQVQDKSKQKEFEESPVPDTVVKQRLLKTPHSRVHDKTKQVDFEEPPLPDDIIKQRWLKTPHSQVQDKSKQKEFEEPPLPDDIIKQRWIRAPHNQPQNKTKQEEFEEPPLPDDIIKQRWLKAPHNQPQNKSKQEEFEELPLPDDIIKQRWLKTPHSRVHDKTKQVDFEEPPLPDDIIKQRWLKMPHNQPQNKSKQEEFEELPLPDNIIKQRWLKTPHSLAQDKSKQEEFEEPPLPDDIIKQRWIRAPHNQPQNKAKQEEFEEPPLPDNIIKQRWIRAPHSLVQDKSKQEEFEEPFLPENGLSKLHDRWLTRSSTHEMFLKTETSDSALFSASELYNEKKLPLRSSKDHTELLTVIGPIQEHLAETQEIIQSNFSEITSLHSSGSLHSSLNLSGEWEEIGTTFKERFDNACQLIHDKLKLSTEFQCLSFFGGNFTRNVTKTLGKDEKPLLFIKMASGRYAKEHERLMKRDAFAYLIDNLFNFGVVPPTVYMMENTIPNVEEKIFHPVFPAIVQLAIPVETQAIPLDVTHIQNAILFNLLTGREDGRRDNSVISTGQKVFEVDNEQIGSQKTDSWLAEEYASVVFQEDLIKNVIEKPEEFITDSFALFEKSYQTLDEDFKDNILHNFRNIVGFFKSRGLSNVQVRELVLAINSLAEPL